MEGPNPQRGLSGAHGAEESAHDHVRVADGPRDFADEVVHKLLDSYRTASGAMQHVNSYELPSMEEVSRIVKLSRTLLYPGFVGGSLVRATETELREFVRARVDELGSLLRRQIYRGLHHQVQSAQGTRDL